MVFRAILALFTFTILFACSPNFSLFSAPDPAPPIALNPAELRSPTPPRDRVRMDVSDLDASAAFAKTLTAGTKEWALRNATLTFEKFFALGKNQSSTANCEAGGPAVLGGDYPTVRLQIPAFTCGDKNPPELELLNTVVASLAYQAVPETDGALNKFRLNILELPAKSSSLFLNPRAVNAFATEEAAFFDLMGEQANGSNSATSNYLDISVQPTDSGEKIQIGFSSDAFTGKGAKISTRLRIQADLAKISH